MGAMDAVFSGTLFMGASFALCVMHKLASQRIPLPFTLLALHTLFIVLVLSVFRSRLRYGSSQDVRRWVCLAPILFTAAAATGVLAILRASPGMVVVGLSAAPILTMVVETTFRKGYQISRGTVIALITVVIGSIVHEAHIKLEREALMWTAAHVVCVAIERLNQRHLMANAGIELAKSTMMLLNNGIALAPFVALAVVFEEHLAWSKHFAALDGKGAGLLAVSCAFAMVASYASLRFQHLVSATTQTVLANANYFVVVMAAAIVGARTQRPEPAQAVGGALAILGAGLYLIVRRAVDVHLTLDASEKDSLTAPTPPGRSPRDSDGSSSDDLA
mmetsp:Transcript_3683/g.10419  ORF Transcript_3683/g.10419 Transcript_3683/m.10419 type:complete len:333 (-) Transcript_3683:145-1143(-)